MARMVDVARKAGVSLKSVSRVLNNEPHVTTALRERVRAAAEAVGYIPSTTARQLRGRRSYTLHLISHADRSNYVNAIQHGAVLACQQRGYQLLVSMVDIADLPDGRGRAERIAALVEASKPDGLILVPPLSNDPAIADRLAMLDVRVARIGPNQLGGAAVTVCIDEREAARTLVTMLVDRGHRRIAFLRGKEDQAATRERYAGYCDALDAAGLPVDPALVLPGTFEFPSGLAAGDQLLQRADPPTAVFAANDDMAAGVIMAAHRLGVPVPDALSVVGFDDSEVADRIWPALTTVRQPVESYGAVAARLLIDSPTEAMVDGQVEQLAWQLIERESVAPPRT